MGEMTALPVMHGRAGCSRMAVAGWLQQDGRLADPPPPPPKLNTVIQR